MPHLLVPALLLVADPLAGAAALDPAVDRWALIGACPRVVPNGTDYGRAATAVCVAAKVGTAYLLTAEHLIGKGDARVYEFFTRDSYPEPARKLIGDKVIVRLPDADVAVVEARYDGDPPPVAPLAGVGQRPKRFPFAAASVGCPKRVAPRFRSEVVIAKTLVRKADDLAAFYWQVEDAPLGGMSGGPLFDAKGRVLGVWAAASGDRGYLSYADEILAGVRKAGHGQLIPAAPPP